MFCCHFHYFVGYSAKEKDWWQEKTLAHLTK